MISIKEEKQGVRLNKQWRTNLYAAFRKWTEESIEDLETIQMLEEESVNTKTQNNEKSDH